MVHQNSLCFKSPQNSRNSVFQKKLCSKIQLQTKCLRKCEIKAKENSDASPSILNNSINNKKEILILHDYRNQKFLWQWMNRSW